MRVAFRWLSALLLTLGMVGAAATSAQAQSPRPAVGWLGVTIQDVTDELRQSLPRGVSDGALVNGVIEGSPAEQAGLEEGDVIVKFDRKRIRDSEDLTDIVREASPGHVAVIEFYRDGGRQTVEARLTEQSGSNVWRPRSEGRRHARRHAPSAPDVQHFEYDAPRGYAFMFGDTPRLGVQLVDLTPQLARHFGVDEGVLVSEVMEGSAAEKAGIQAGDIIVAVGDERTGDSRDVREELGRMDTGNVEITVKRGGREQSLTAELTKPRKARMSDFRGHSTPMFNIPELRWDSEEFKEQMEELREELDELRQELSELRDDRR